MNGHIQNRLIAALLAVAALPLAGVGLYGIHSSTEALRSLSLSSAQEGARLKARKVEEMLRDVRGDILFLARSPMLLSFLDESGRDSVQADFWRRKLGQQFLALAQSKTVYAGLRYLDETGREEVHAAQDGLRAWMVPDGRRPGTRDYFRAAAVLPAGEVYISSSDRAAGETREPVVHCAMRVIDRRGGRRGVLVADVFSRQIVNATRRSGVSEGGQTALLGDDDRPLSPAGALHFPVGGQVLAEVRGRLRSGASTVVVEQEGAIVSWAPVWAGMPGGAPLWLVADTVPGGAAFGSVHRFQMVVAGLVALTVAAALGLSLVLSRRIARPLAEMRDGARRMAGGDFAHRLRVRTGDEVEALAEEFNRMGQALEETYRRLRERDEAKTEQLQRVGRQLVESEKLAAVGLLAAGVAHEVNNPIGVVSMFAQRLLERGDLSEADREKLRIIERHADRIGRITRGLLDFARPREQRRAPVDVSRSVEATLKSFAPHLAEAGVAAEHRAPPGVAAVISGDEEQLQQVFANLTRNAIQAMPGGGGLVVAVDRGPSEVVLTFSDTGPGIPEEHLGRVFEPFFTTKEVGQGTGLGLAISYGIVRAHGGWMRAANRPGGGAVFTVALPAEGGDTREAQGGTA